MRDMALAFRMKPTDPAPPSARVRAVPDLLADAQAGDRAAMEQLLVLLAPRVRNLVRYLVRGDAEVDDIAQEALSAIFRKLETYKGEGTFVSWIDRIAARCAFAYRKRLAAWRAKASPVSSGPPSELSWGPTADEYAARRRVVQLLDALPGEQRDALVLHHVVGMTAPEIARELSVPEGTVRSRLRLGMARLRDLMHLDEEVAHEDE
jgi:RNA polymerase sigma-70 factor (ECF subfamily)